jgi:cell division protein FtsQ
MWNRPVLLNGIANALFAVAALLTLFGAWKLAAHQPLFELREVTVGGTLAHITRSEIEDVVRRELKGSFLTLDLDAVRAAFQQLPWVHRASVRRQWPGRLEVTLEEHVPLARWGTGALVNTEGDVFRASYKGELPQFVGPEGAAREMAIQYRYFRKSLETIGQAPVRLEVSPRRAWKVRLASGVTLALGREQVEARLARFVAMHDRALAPLGPRVDYVDLRYANGFAVRLAEPRRGKAPKRGMKSGQRAG